MNINPKVGGSIRPEVASTTPSIDQADKAIAPVPSAAPVAARNDQVQISDAGRALAARDSSKTSLDPARAAQIRQRVLDGAYNSLSVVDEVANRILKSGDL
jgi:negative regulator of flagellin synthesis FlgM